MTINEGEKAGDEEIYLNIRAEAAFRGREWLIRGGCVVGDELKRDITGYAYKFSDRTGKKQLMPKHELKKRMGRSPDRGDAWMMTFITDYSMDYHAKQETEEESDSGVSDDPSSTGGLNDAI